MASTPEVTRTVNVPLYLQALSQLPEVTGADIETVRGALRPLMDGSQITFSQGVEGDGKVRVFTQIASSAGSSRLVNSVFYLDEQGRLNNPDTNFRAVLPSPLSVYFFGGIFGIEEMTPSTKSNPTSYFSHVNQNFAGLVHGLRHLYICLEQNQTLEACQNSEGSRLLATTKVQVEQAKAKAEEARALNAAINTAMGELTSLQSQLRFAKTEYGQLAPASGANLVKELAPLELQLPETTTTLPDIQRAIKVVKSELTVIQALVQDAKRLQIRGETIQKTEALWRIADQMYQNSIGPGGGDSDVILGIINGYRSYRSYVDSSDTLEQATARYSRAAHMMYLLGSNDEGFEQFKKHFCRSAGGQGREVKCYEGSYVEYPLQCDFGVNARGGTTRVDQGCTSKEKEEKEPKVPFRQRYEVP